MDRFNVKYEGGEARLMEGGRYLLKPCRKCDLPLLEAIAGVLNSAPAGQSLSVTLKNLAAGRCA